MGSDDAGQQAIDLSVCGVCGKSAVQWTYAGTTAAAPQMPGVYTPQINGAYCAEHSPFRMTLSNSLETLYAQEHAEVERLRAREAALVAEREQAMVVVRAVAESDGHMARLWDGTPAGYMLLPQHEGIIAQARALLAAGESEQEGGGDGG